jgi:hypothetical protein
MQKKMCAPGPPSWLAGEKPGALETRNDRRESRNASRLCSCYRRPETVVPIEGRILRCLIPGCIAKCTVSPDELALGMPQRCDWHLYEGTA